MTNIFGKTTQFVRNVVVELKRVSWPTRRQMVSYTITVLITVAFIAVFFAVVDKLISAAIRLIV